MSGANEPIDLRAFCRWKASYEGVLKQLHEKTRFVRIATEDSDRDWATRANGLRCKYSVDEDGWFIQCVNEEPPAPPPAPPVHEKFLNDADVDRLIAEQNRLAATWSEVLAELLETTQWIRNNIAKHPHTPNTGPSLGTWTSFRVHWQLKHTAFGWIYLKAICDKDLTPAWKIRAAQPYRRKSGNTSGISSTGSSV